MTSFNSENTPQENFSKHFTYSSYAFIGWSFFVGPIMTGITLKFSENTPEALLQTTSAIALYAGLTAGTFSSMIYFSKKSENVLKPTLKEPIKITTHKQTIQQSKIIEKNKNYVKS